LIDNNYFPLTLGNSWTYSSKYDTSYQVTFSVFDTIRLNDKLYYLYGKQNSLADTLSKDSLGNVWKYQLGSEHKWFDFSLDSGSTYIYWFAGSDTMIVYVIKYLELSVLAGYFNDCIDLWFDIPGVIDDEKAYCFAPNVGIILMHGAWMYQELLRSEIVSVFDNSSIPHEVILYQNYPNPFNPYTTIRFDIPQTSLTSLKIYDLLGREVMMVLDELKTPGSYNVSINAVNLTSGMYFYRLKVGDSMFSRKFVVLK
jgi:hypothetical protein